MRGTTAGRAVWQRIARFGVRSYANGLRLAEARRLAQPVPPVDLEIVLQPQEQPIALEIGEVERSKP